VPAAVKKFRRREMEPAIIVVAGVSVGFILLCNAARPIFIADQRDQEVRRARRAWPGVDRLVASLTGLRDPECARAALRNAIRNRAMGRPSATGRDPESPT
jgi:hypothetical protein